MKTHWNFAGLFTVLAIIASSNALALDSEPKSEELQVLERYIGSWQETVTSKPALWTPEKTTTVITGTRQWILQNHMVENKGAWSLDNKQFLHLTTYDRMRKEYRQWYYDKDTLIPQESRGTWDAATETFTFTGTLADGVQTTSQQKFVDRDRFTWTLVAKNRADNVVLDIEAKCVRKK